MTTAHNVVLPLVDTVSVHVVSPHWAARVVSPLHDVLTESERRAVLAENPDSYLHVTSDPLALLGTLGDASAAAAQEHALQRLLDLGAYRCLPEPGVFVYRMREGADEHTGVVASVGMDSMPVPIEVEERREEKRPRERAG